MFAEALLRFILRGHTPDEQNEFELVTRTVSCSFLRADGNERQLVVCVTVNQFISSCDIGMSTQVISQCLTCFRAHVGLSGRCISDRFDFPLLPILTQIKMFKVICAFVVCLLTLAILCSHHVDSRALHQVSIDL